MTWGNGGVLTATQLGKQLFWNWEDADVMQDPSRVKLYRSAMQARNSLLQVLSERDWFTRDKASRGYA